MVGPLIAPLVLVAVFVLIAKASPTLNRIATGCECPACESKRIQMVKAGAAMHANCDGCGNSVYY